jgi:DNA-binding CsgD family transcriptional regulator
VAWQDSSDRGARLLVQIVDPVERRDDRIDLLRDAYGLTVGEARTAALVGSGLSNPAVAAALGISVNTVRTQLARCFDKTGVHSQVALARIVCAITR